MKLSQSTFVYFYYPLKEAVKRIADAGYDGVEIWGGRPHAYRRDLGKSELKEIRSLIINEGIEVSAFIPAQFRYPTSLVSPRKKVRNESVDYIRESFSVAKYLGTNMVTVCPGHTIFGQSFEKGWKLLRDGLSRLIEHARQYDITLLLEPGHKAESDLVMTAADALRIIHEIKENRMGVLLDSGHCAINKEVLTNCVKNLARSGCTFHIHVDDNNGLVDEHLIPGRGRIDFAPFLRELKRVTYEGFLTVELGFQYILDADSAIRESREFFRKLVEEL